MIEESPRAFKEAFLSALMFHQSPPRVVVEPGANFGRRLILALTWNLKTSDGARWASVNRISSGHFPGRSGMIEWVRRKIVFGSWRYKVPLSLGQIITVLLVTGASISAGIFFGADYKILMTVAVALPVALQFSLTVKQLSLFEGTLRSDLDRTMSSEMLANALELAIGDLYRLAMHGTELKRRDLVWQAEQVLLPSERVIGASNYTDPQALALYHTVHQMQKMIKNGSNLEDEELDYLINIALIQLDNLRSAIEQRFRSLNQPARNHRPRYKRRSTTRK